MVGGLAGWVLDGDDDMIVGIVFIELVDKIQQIHFLIGIAQNCGGFNSFSWFWRLGQIHLAAIGFELKLNRNPPTGPFCSPFPPYPPVQSKYKETAQRPIKKK